MYVRKGIYMYIYVYIYTHIYDIYDMYIIYMGIYINLEKTKKQYIYIYMHIKI